MMPVLARLLLAALLLGTAGGAARAQCANDNLTRVTAGKDCLAIRTFADQAGAGPKQLVIFLHGDQSDGGPVVGMINNARDVPVPAGTVKVAMLRPGYGDRDGNNSTGENYGRSDSYTAQNIDEVAAAIKALQAYYKPTRTVIVGHSGGAAYAGVIIGRHPGLVDSALLLSCPCDIDRWRSSGRGWSRSLSPNKFADKVPPTTRVIAMTGSKDTNTGSSLAESYIKQLSARGVSAEFRMVPGAEHNDTNNKDVMAAPLAALLN